MKIALVYDRVNKWGGAEQVLLALNEIFPTAPLFTSVYSPEKASWARNFPTVKTSFLQKIPFAKDNHELLGLFTPIAFEAFDFSEFDIVISVTSEAAKGIITSPKTTHICYCLTPTRYLWSGNNEYFKGQIFKVMTKPMVRYLRNWDKAAASRPDVIIAISHEVQNRIKKYYERESEIIYPPVDVEKFNTNKATPILSLPKDYYLVVSRLVPYKRVDLVVEAFNDLNLPLVIVGTGSEEKKLKSKAKKNIRFAGFVTESDLISYYFQAKAFIFPQIEDFGIAAVEAQAAGVPVIAHNKGGALDTVFDGKTGVFFKTQTKKSLISAVNEFQRMSFEKNAIKLNARRFSKKRFQKQIADYVTRVHT